MAPAGYGDRIEGLHAVSAALDAGRVRGLTVERKRASRNELGELVDTAHSLGISVGLVDDVRPLAATSAPQGVIADCVPLRFVELSDLVSEESPASLLVIDHLEDAHNVGAVARSAVAAGIPRMVVSDRRSAPLGPAAFKAAAGAFERCRVAVHSSIADALGRLQDLDVWTVGLDAGGSVELFGYDLLAEPVAVVIGGETGLSRLVRERCEVIASIPMVGGVDSLNASVAAALACFEVFRVRGTTGWRSSDGQSS